MVESKTTMAYQIARAAIAFSQRRTGDHGPKSVTVVLSEGTLVNTLCDALSLAKKAMSKSTPGVAQFRELLRELSANSSDSFRHEIQRITNGRVRCDRRGPASPHARGRPERSSQQ
jgi:hypothetical protein